jgi:hypothetical protein
MKRLVFLAAFLTAAGAMPATGEDQKFHPIDLQPLANQKRSESLGSGIEGNHLANLPGGDQSFGGVKFLVEDGILHLGSKILDRHPDKIVGIKVNAKCVKLHILHATCFGGGPNKPGDALHVPDGTPIGQYMVHYADGSGEGIPIVYGEDVRDWFYLDDEAATSRGKVVWNGDNDRASQLGARIRVYLTSWKNPNPDKQIVSIDYIGKKEETPAAPFCVAISREE